jgi:hypothetical protein
MSELDLSVPQRAESTSVPLTPSSDEPHILTSSVMKLQIRVDDNGVISDVKFKTFGCGSAIASSSYMTERVKGMTLDQAGQVKNTEIAKELCLPPVKRESRVFRSTGYSMEMTRRIIMMNADMGHWLTVQCTARCSPRTRSSLRSRTTRVSGRRGSPWLL